MPSEDLAPKTLIVVRNFSYFSLNLICSALGYWSVDVDGHVRTLLLVFKQTFIEMIESISTLMIQDPNNETKQRPAWVFHFDMQTKSVNRILVKRIN